MPLIVSVSSLKGGVGKTSVTLGLASAALAAEMNVLVIDMDPHADATTGLAVESGGTDIGTMLFEPEQYDLSAEVVASGWNAIAESAAAEKQVQEKAENSEDSDSESSDATEDSDEHEGELSTKETTSPKVGSISVVRGSPTATPIETLPTQELLPNLLELLRGEVDDYDLVLIDCPPTLGHLTSIAWAASDRVVSIAEPSLFSVAGTERTMRAIARFASNSDYSVDSASVVINKLREENPEHVYRVEEMKNMFGALVADPPIPDYEQFQRVQGSAYPVHFWPEPEAQKFSKKLSELLEGLLR